MATAASTRPCFSIAPARTVSRTCLSPSSLPAGFAPSFFSADGASSAACWSSANSSGRRPLALVRRARQPRVQCDQDPEDGVAAEMHLADRGHGARDMPCCPAMLKPRMSKTAGTLTRSGLRGPS